MVEYVSTCRYPVTAHEAPAAAATVGSPAVLGMVPGFLAAAVVRSPVGVPPVVVRDAIPPATKAHKRRRTMPDPQAEERRLFSLWLISDTTKMNKK